MRFTSVITLLVVLLSVPTTLSAQTRSELTEAIFGTETLPNTVPTLGSGTSPIEPTVGGTITKLTTTTSDGNNYAWEHMPDSPNGIGVIVWQGHQDGPSLHGIVETCKYFFDRNCTVIVGGMPGRGGNGGSANHNVYFPPGQSGNFEPFISPPVALVNYLTALDPEGNPFYSTIVMTGVSGGGWTTLVTSAVDTRINYAFPVAGWLPYHMRTGTSYVSGDEQDAIRTIIPYVGLAALAGMPDPLVPNHREHVSFFNPDDSCCFGYDTTYGNGSYGDFLNENVIVPANFTANLFGGSVDWYEYTDAPGQHVISTECHTVMGQILNLSNPPPPTVFFIDNLDAGFSVYGPTLPQNTSGAQDGWVHYDYTGPPHFLNIGYGGTTQGYKPVGAVEPDTRAEWNFGSVPPGTYDVEVSWEKHPNRATSVKYEVESDGEVIYNTTMSQYGTYVAGVDYQIIGRVTTIQEGIIVRLVVHAGQNGYSMADSVRLIPVE